MGNSISLTHQEIKDIQAETGFWPSQIRRLYGRFLSLDKVGRGYLTREDLLNIQELLVNPLGDRIIHAFFKEGLDDRISFRQFVKVLARFRPLKDKQENKLNCRDEKLRFAFNVYDLDNDNQIARADLLQILHVMVGGDNISEKQISSIADRTILEADRNGDGMISYAEFCSVVENLEIEDRMSVKFLK